jgi:hypothetical protein
MIADRIKQKQLSSWCFVSNDGSAFYLDEPRAKAMQADHGGYVFAPGESCAS